MTITITENSSFYFTNDITNYAILISPLYESKLSNMLKVSNYLKNSITEDELIDMIVEQTISLIDKSIYSRYEELLKLKTSRRKSLCGYEFLCRLPETPERIKSIIRIKHKQGLIKIKR